MNRILDQVSTFQKSFGQMHNTVPQLIDHKTGKLRFDLMSEENDEYLAAVLAEDLTGVADALGDMLYILSGTIISHGMQDIITKIFNEILDSNMSKLDKNGNPIINGENGVLDKSRAMGKVLKPDSYFKPRLTPIISSGIVNGKRKIADKIYRDISYAKFLFDTAHNEEQRRAYYNRLKELESRLTEVNLSMSELKLNL